MDLLKKRTMLCDGRGTSYRENYHKQEKHKKELKLQNFRKIFFLKKKKNEIMKEWILLKNT